MALWSITSPHCHPSTPHADLAEKILLRIEREDLAPYETRGNRICRDHYDELVLPWQCEPPVEAFPKDKHVRQDWDRDGLREGAEQFFVGGQQMTIRQTGRVLSSASPVIRWREAHPHLAHTKDDVIEKGLREVRDLVGQEEIAIGKSSVLLLFKKQ